MLVVGLTGGVASGKTVVSQVLKEEGAYLIDADQIARTLVQPRTPVWDELRRTFGEDILGENGSIHRKKLAARIFSNPDERDLLNRILHPRIKQQMDRRVEEIREEDPDAIVVIDAALLVESGNYREMDKVIVIATTETKQIERLRGRQGLSEEEARRMVSSQISAEERLKVADYVIQNEGSLEETRKRAKEIFQELKRLALQKKDQPRFHNPN